ncbi:MAG: PRD domain-containing protein [Pelosinus sp.]|nr:PRD domain-containing protein [Pelosinus sp.]
MKNSDYRVIKAFNNSVVLALEENKERILIAKGIGFGKKTGDIIKHDTPFEKVFTIDDAENSGRFRQLLKQVSDDIFILCENIIHMVSSELGEELDEKIHINLVDHIAFMIKRVSNGDEIVNPFQIEVAILYKREFELAEKAVAILEDSTKLQIPDGEIGFIAMHIHSARNNGKLSQTIKSAFLSNSIIELIEENTNTEIDRQSLDYARFITHVRFTVERLMSNAPIKNELLDAIKEKYRDSYALAEKIGQIIASELAIKAVPEDELGYLAIHIEKLRNREI